MTGYDVWLAGIEHLGKESLYVLWRAAGQNMDFAEMLYRMTEGELTEFCEKAFQMENQKRLQEERRIAASSQVNKTIQLLKEAKDIFNQESDLQELVQGMERKGIRYIWAGDTCFPRRLRYIENPPFGLFVKGRLPEDDRPSVGIVGTRMASAYGRDQAKRFAAELAAEGVQIISGMARGVDGVAGRGALDVSDNSFAVLGGGVDICYPRENADLYEALAERGGLISEYRPGLQPQSRFFPARNRIISGLADVILVIEAREQSGTLITVDRALEQGKDVWAIPGRICDRNSSGCNRLIRQGAGIALSPELLLEALGVKEAKEEYEEGTGQFGDAGRSDYIGGAGPVSYAEPAGHSDNAGCSDRVGWPRRGHRCAQQAKQVQMSFDFEALSGECELERPESHIAEGCLGSAIWGELDASTPKGLDDMTEEISHRMGRDVPYSELMRELTRLMLKGKVQEIRVGQYIRKNY